MSKVKDLLALGKIVKIHGLKGAVKVSSYLESNEVIEKLKDVYLGPGEGKEGSKLFQIKRTRIDKKGFIVEFDGVEKSEEAEKLVGLEVLIPSDRLEQLPDGEYYWKDLIGLEVSTEEGEYLGEIDAIFPTGSNDIYVCRGGGREILLPAISDVIINIDLGEGRMIVRLMKGM